MTRCQIARRTGCAGPGPADTHPEKLSLTSHPPAYVTFPTCMLLDIIVVTWDHVKYFPLMIPSANYNRPSSTSIGY